MTNVQTPADGLWRSIIQKSVAETAIIPGPQQCSIDFRVGDITTMADGLKSEMDGQLTACECEDSCLLRYS